MATHLRALQSGAVRPWSGVVPSLKSSHGSLENESALHCRMGNRVWSPLQWKRCDGLASRSSPAGGRTRKFFGGGVRSVLSEQGGASSLVVDSPPTNDEHALEPHSRNSVENGIGVGRDEPAESSSAFPMELPSSSREREDVDVNLHENGNGVNAEMNAPSEASVAHSESAGEVSTDEVLEMKGEEDRKASDVIEKEVTRRRNFAIISHPDAGKTTLTEKLLLYGGAIHEAGEVKARKASRHATSDWMELEKQRGISITSTAMMFESQGKQINLLDTPGHQDFGEDTFRTLSAADNAVMLVDAGKGLEPQTKKLFEVCRMRKLPIFTFMNKMDRPSLEPLALIDEIEKEFELSTFPVNWPIGSGDRFKGVYDRLKKQVHLFTRGFVDGKRETSVEVMNREDPRLPQLIDPDVYQQFCEEVELLDELGPDFDLEQVHNGELTLVFFGSAMNNFGVELFLESFLEYSLPPTPHTSSIGVIDPAYPHFTGFVFKLQANMDPKHRDKVAFIRVCSGEFTKGMKVNVWRTQKSVALTRPQKLFAQERNTLENAYAGDVIGLNNPNCFSIGDTVYCGPALTFPGIPTFSPELFAYLKNPNPSKYKQFVKGVDELMGEGAVQVLYAVDGRSDPILAAIGQLQFEVVQYRLENEYGVPTSLEPLGFSIARWVNDGWEALSTAGRLFNCMTVKDRWGRPVLLFRNEWNVSQLLSDHPKIGELSPYALPPDEFNLTAN